ncbi:fumarylacetoacetate hydrolase family protein [Parapedobacter koreensis]|uniref:Fumarylacetoacetate (FAA) hydrolase n=1 Tax=Parapedobacter koreensis TaxID=332977 RepID=A0A1H7MAG2_9SPHI|nr:fumarylacetoacetate hydrolase family protein [Parapedobacter koreensis]SEL08320.1 fumarylacetoacetate (FAA) hydrolase [Parapedobacter koreensis]
MKLVSYLTEGKEGCGIVLGTGIFPLERLGNHLPTRMATLLEKGHTAMDDVKAASNKLADGSPHVVPLSGAQLLAPVPRPASCRDAYAFRQHVATSRRNRGLEMIPEFDLFPVFYFSNHQAVYGPGDIPCMPLQLDQLDFELEVAVVLNRKGRNIPAAEADSYIGGYMIMNDFSARKLQMEEMKLNLGPAKGKDFATAFGPWLVTPDELEPYRVPPPKGHIGHTHDLAMRCVVNGEKVSEGRLADMAWTFAEIIERASYGATLYPGDIIGSGTVGTGCFLELNSTARLTHPLYKDRWLRPGDTVELEVTGLGKLINSIVNDDQT